jgi:hypothetical protein
MAKVASYFRYWTGTITFRFEVIASPFHKGTFMVIYEPFAENAVNICSKTTDYNQQSIAMIDLSKDRNVTLDVKYTNTRSFTSTAANSTIDLDDHFFTSPATTPSDIEAAAPFSAGFIYLRAAIPIISPNDNPVRVNVYAYSEDIEFAEPDREGRYFTAVAESQMGPSYGEQMNTTTGSRTMSRRETLNESTYNKDNIFLYHFGEKVQSFRSLLKREFRYYRHNAPLPSAVATSFILSVNTSLYPPFPTANFPGYTGDAPTLGGTCFHTIFSSLRLCYLGMKGGFRHTLTINGDPDGVRNVSYPSTVILSNRTGNAIWAPDIIAEGSTESDSTMVGFVRVDPSKPMEVEVPYYSIDQFSLAFDLNGHSGTESAIQLFENSSKGALFHASLRNFGTDDVFFELSARSAEDFTFFRFQGCDFYTPE